MLEKPVFLQGLFPYEPSGLNKPRPFAPESTYKGPNDRRAQLVYFRAGNPADELVRTVPAAIAKQCAFSLWVRKRQHMWSLPWWKTWNQELYWTF